MLIILRLLKVNYKKLKFQKNIIFKKKGNFKKSNGFRSCGGRRHRIRCHRPAGSACCRRRTGRPSESPATGPRASCSEWC